VVITGASTGLGYSLSRHLSGIGCKVFACGRSRPKNVPDSVVFSQVDIRNPDSVSSWSSEVSEAETKIDMLINNAAILPRKAPFEQIAFKDWENTFRTNVLGTVTVTRAFLPALRCAKNSTVINVGSILGKHGRAGWATYAVSKSAVATLTEVLAQELCTSGVRVLTILPSRVRTELRKRAYPFEMRTPGSSENLGALTQSIEWLLRNSHLPITGLTLSSNDWKYWTNGAR